MTRDNQTDDGRGGRAWRGPTRDDLQRLRAQLDEQNRTLERATLLLREHPGVTVQVDPSALSELDDAAGTAETVRAPLLADCLVRC